MIGILHHPKIARSKPLADEVADWLTGQGQTIWRASVWDEAQIATRIADSSLLITLGGDGSIMRAARIAAPYQCPVFSINLGRLGFLSEASPDDWQARLIKVLAGKHRLERRLMLRVNIYRDSEEIGDLLAINEVVIGRGAQARVVRLNLFVDGDHANSYVADALIAATATGSTAYAMAAGGPILPPEVRNYVIVPVAPFLSMERPIVLSAEATATIGVEFDHEATVTVDGQQSIHLQSGDVVEITKAAHDSIFVRVDHSSSYFYQRLMALTGGFEPKTAPRIVKKSS